MERRSLQLQGQARSSPTNTPLHPPPGALTRGAGGVVGEVDVTASAVPVAGDGLGVKGHLHVVQLCGRRVERRRVKERGGKSRSKGGKEEEEQARQMWVPAATVACQDTSRLGRCAAHSQGAPTCLPPCCPAALPSHPRPKPPRLTADPVEQVAGHPQLVAAVNAHAGAHLVLPLQGGVGARKQGALMQAARGACMQGGWLRSDSQWAACHSCVWCMGKNVLPPHAQRVCLHANISKPYPS